MLKSLKKRTHASVEDDVGIALVELALVALVLGVLLHDGELLNAPDLEAGTLTGALEAGVEDRRHAKLGG